MVSTPRKMIRYWYMSNSRDIGDEGTYPFGTDEGIGWTENSDSLVDGRVVVGREEDGGHDEAELLARTR
jgi:hypothetical protein